MLIHPTERNSVRKSQFSKSEMPVFRVDENTIHRRIIAFVQSSEHVVSTQAIAFLKDTVIPIPSRLFQTTFYLRDFKNERREKPFVFLSGI